MRNEERKKKSIFKQWWFWTIIGFCLIITTIATIFSLKIDYAKKISQLKDEGYDFIHIKDDKLTKTEVVCLGSEKESITISKGKNKDGTTYTFLDFSNLDINDDNIINERIDITKNITDKREQYKSYKRWLKKHKLTSKQLIKLLDYYEENGDT